MHTLTTMCAFIFVHSCVHSHYVKFLRIVTLIRSWRGFSNTARVWWRNLQLKFKVSFSQSKQPICIKLECIEICCVMQHLIYLAVMLSILATVWFLNVNISCLVSCSVCMCVCMCVCWLIRLCSELEWYPFANFIAELSGDGQPTETPRTLFRALKNSDWVLPPFSCLVSLVFLFIFFSTLYQRHSWSLQCHNIIIYVCLLCILLFLSVTYMYYWILSHVHVYVHVCKINHSQCATMIICLV